MSDEKVHTTLVLRAVMLSYPETTWSATCTLPSAFTAPFGLEIDNIPERVGSFTYCRDCGTIT